MSLVTRINLALSAAFLLGLVIAGFISYSVLQENAKLEAAASATLLMESAQAAMSYTSMEIRPLLSGQKKFLPQSVPNYSATQILEHLRKEFPDYAYKSAMLNPTNLKDKATDWEADLIQNFITNAAQKELVGERLTPTGPSLYVARAIRIADGKCLACHTSASTAPPTMVSLYGPANGFGWKMNEVVGSEIVSVPMSVPIQKANHSFMVFFASLIGAFAVIFVVINIILRLLIVRPIASMAATADRLSSGDMSAPELHFAGENEISRLGKSFNRMRKSLEKMAAMLK